MILSLASKRRSHQTADDEREPGLVVMFSGHDDVPSLTSATVAGLDLHWGEVLSEVS